MTFLRRRQEDLFERARVGEMLEAVLGGFHATLFAYGQTGSGKTHCMEGFKYKRLKVRTLPSPPPNHHRIVPFNVQPLLLNHSPSPSVLICAAR